MNYSFKYLNSILRSTLSPNWAWGNALFRIYYIHFQGGLLILLTDGRTSACGSSLLSHTKAVTAAHCWTDGTFQARQFTVVLGSTRLFSGGVRIVSTNVVMHPQWNPRTTYGDVAIITMAHVNFNSEYIYFAYVYETSSGTTNFEFN